MFEGCGQKKTQRNKRACMPVCGLVGFIKSLKKICLNTITKLGKQIFIMNDFSDIQCKTYSSCLRDQVVYSICHYFLHVCARMVYIFFGLANCN